MATQRNNNRARILFIRCYNYANSKYNQITSICKNSLIKSSFDAKDGRFFGFPGRRYEKDGHKGLVVCGKISKPGQSADYTFTVRYTNGTSSESDDYIFTKSYTGKTLNAKDAVKLPMLRNWTCNFTRINGHDFVDMGNGVLWATRNLGATYPEDYGYYYAWGETEPKTYYSLTNYKHLAPEPHTLPYLEGYISKYQFDDATYSVVLRYKTIWYDENRNFIGDNKLVLDPEDDAAIANWDGPWRTQNTVAQGRTDRLTPCAQFGLQCVLLHKVPGVWSDLAR